MKFPKLLKKGDTIGVCAPSAGVPEHLLHRLDNAKQNIESLGYTCLEVL